MNPVIRCAALVALATFALADVPLETASPLNSTPSTSASENPSVPADKTNWSVAGEWQVSHPSWKGALIIRPDGTFLRPHGDGGKWTLSAQGDQLALKLIWDSWVTDTALMIAPDLFRGEVRSGLIELRRGEKRVAEDAAATPPLSPPKDFDAPDLKAKLADSTWALRDGKHFTLHADGSTSGDWHDRKRVLADRVARLDPVDDQLADRSSSNGGRECGRHGAEVERRGLGADCKARQSGSGKAVGAMPASR